MRLDLYLVEHGLATGRGKAKELVERGAVKVNGSIAKKASLEVGDDVRVEVEREMLLRYVGRGGLKLEAALDAFSIAVERLVCVDIGASTGGFTDCLLERGAARVYAVDCGRGQLAPKLLEDPRVVSIEGFNARELCVDTLGERCELAVMDVSFISQTLLYPAVTRVLCDGGRLISLIKPQFEVGRAGLGKNGIVKSESERKRAVERVLASADTHGLKPLGVIDSPIKGGDGNTEYLAVFEYSAGNADKAERQSL